MGSPGCTRRLLLQRQRISYGHQVGIFDLHGGWQLAKRLVSPVSQVVKLAAIALSPPCQSQTELLPEDRCDKEAEDVRRIGRIDCGNPAQTRCASYAQTESL